MKLKNPLLLILIVVFGFVCTFGQTTTKKKGVGIKTNKTSPTPAPTPTPTPAPIPAPTPVVNTISVPAPVSTQPVTTPRKKRIAVMSFEFANIAQTSPYQSQQISIGQGFTSTLMTKLVQEGTYTIVERGQIQKVLDELKLGTTANMDKETTARLGRILGVDALLYGTFTKVGPKGKNASIFDTKSNGGTVGTITSILGGSGRSQVELILNFFVANAETAEILQVPGNITALSKKKTAMTPQGIEDDVLREAFDDAIGKIITNLVSSGNLIPDATFDVNGAVVDVDGSTIMIDLGRGSGVREGDRLAVKKVLKVIYAPNDPKTILDYRMEKIGEIVITKINERTSIGTYTPLTNSSPTTSCRVTRN